MYKKEKFFMFQTANMSLNGDLQNVLPSLNATEPCSEVGEVGAAIDPLHPNQEVQLEQINEGEMVENKLVIPDEMERYLSQVAAILDTEEPQLTELTTADSKSESKTEAVNNHCNTDNNNTLNESSKDIQNIQQVFPEFQNEDLANQSLKKVNTPPVAPVPPIQNISVQPTDQSDNKSTISQSNMSQTSRNFHNFQNNQCMTPHTHDHVQHYYHHHHQNFHYCGQPQGNHYHNMNYQTVANQQGSVPDRNGYNNFNNFRCHPNGNKPVQNNQMCSQAPVSNQNYQQQFTSSIPHSHQGPVHMCQNHSCYSHDHCSSCQQNNCSNVCQPPSLHPCGSNQIHSCNIGGHHVVNNSHPVHQSMVPNHAPPMLPPGSGMQHHVSCSCNGNHEIKQQHKICGSCHYQANGTNFKENDKNLYKNFTENYENEIQCTDISQSEVRMPRDAYERTLEYVQQCQIWSNEVSSSTHPTSNMVVNDLTSSLNSLMQENRFFQMIN